MNAVLERLMIFAPFFLVMLTLVSPGIVSVVGRVKSFFKKVEVPSWAWWLTSIVASVAAAYCVSYVFSVVELYTPPGGITAIIGVLIGLHSSGTVDLSKYRAGTKK